MRAACLVGSAIVSSLLATGSASAQAKAPRYAVTDLGDLGGGEAFATAINEAGQIVGYSYLPGHTAGDSCDERRAFLWDEGAMSELASLPGTRFALASGISESGDVAGANYVYAPNPACTGGCVPGSCGSRIPVLVRDGQPIDLSAAGPRWSDGVMTRLPPLGPSTSCGANDINAAGVIVGWCGANATVSTPVLYDASGDVVDLVGLGGTQGSAYALNERGDVVGYAYTSGNQRRHAFLYRDGQVWDLNALVRPSLGLELIAATGISDAGRIVGFGCVNSRVLPPQGCVDADGTRTFARAFLLTPVPPVGDLESLVRSLGPPASLETSLLAKLAAARRAIEGGRIAASCHLLAAFANEVEAQAGKGLTGSQAALLLETLALVQADPGCA